MLDEQLALEKLVVLAIAETIVRETPMVHHAPMLEVRHRLDTLVHAAIDRYDHAPDLGREREDRGFGNIHGALGRIPFAEIGPSGNGTGAAGTVERLGGRRQRSQGLRLRRRSAECKRQRDAPDLKGRYDADPL